MRKHLLTFMAVLLCSLTASAHSFESGGIYYNITSSTDLTVAVTYRGDSYNSYSNEYSGAVTIPSTVTYNNKIYSVTSIGERAFYNCYNLTSITIPESVTSIGESAFSFCSSLTSITIPEGVTSIGDYAFRDCRLLTSITIPEGVTSIGDYAFFYCWSLTSITIPESVTSIGEMAFDGCSGLIQVTLNCSYIGSWFNYNSSIEKVVLGESVTSIGSRAFSGCSGLTTVNIPESVTSIGEDAFYNCSGLTTVNIPESVTSIGSSAFYNCSSLTAVHINSLEAWCNIDFANSSSNPLFYAKNLFLNEELVTALTIPEGVSSIGSYAFSGCSSLTSITIPESVTSIGNYAFDNCSALKEVIIEDGSNTLSLGYNYYSSSSNGGQGLFYDCPLESVYLGRNLSYNSGKSYGYSPFYSKTQLTTLTIGENVTSIENYAFDDCSALKEVIIEDGSNTLSFGYNYYSSSYIGEGLFYDCPLVSVYLGRNLSYNSGKSYGYSPFYNKTKLTSLTIGENVTSIGNYAFDDCTALKEVIIEDGSKMLSLGSNDDYQGLFYDCPLESVYLGRNLSYNSDDSYGYSPFYNKTKLTSLTIGENVTSIGNYAFSDCSSLTAITIPEGVTSIGSSTFYNCSSLTEVHISDIAAWCNIKFSINSFTHAHNLYLNGKPVTELTIPEGVTSIGNYAFRYCSSLTAITIPAGVTSIGERAFDGCSSLTSITIPNSVTSIGNGAFWNCSSLTEVHISDIAAWCNIKFSSTPLNYAHNLYLNGKLVTELTIPAGVTSIGEWAFYYCSNLTSITIPESVTSIGQRAFYHCSSLTSITIPEGVTSIDDSAFMSCWSLTSITIPESVTSIGQSAFDGCSSLTSITIPEGVTSIGDWTFRGCGELTSITIPEGVTYIGFDAFGGCTLDYLIVHSTSLDTEYTQGNLKVKKLLVPESALNFYKSSNWSQYCTSIENIEANPTPAYISNHSFEGGTYNCDNGTGNGNLYAPGGWQVNYTKADWGNMNFRPLSDGKGQDGNQYFEFWADTYHTFDMNQRLHSLPAGTYRLTAAMRTERADQVTNQHIYAKVGDKTYTSATLGAPIGSAWNAVDAWQTLSVEFTLDKASSVVIGATSTGGAGSKGWFQIDNFRLSVLVNNVSLNKTSAAIMGGETLSLSATVSPDNAINKTVTWTSSNTAVATVDSNGKVRGVGSGTAIITAKAGSKTATCEVKVTIPVSSISLNKTSAAINGGETLALTATINPSNATDKSVTWSSSNTAVATVDSDGQVTGVGSGTAIITAKAGSKTATCEVKVTIPVSSVSLNKTTATIYDGETLTLSATVSPSNATDKTVTWSSDNTAVATVDVNGKVTTVAPGTATITAKAGEKSATCVVTVKVTDITNVSLSQNSVVMSKNETLTLSATVSPNNATDKTVTWSSNNSAVATVDSNGKVTAKSAGVATITAKAGDQTATCEVSVKGWVLDYATGHLMVNDDFDEDYPWSDVLSAVASVEFGPFATMVGAQAFVNAIGLRKVVFSENLKRVGAGAFKGCIGLKELDLGEVVIIGANAFENCDGLTSIVIPSSIRSIQSYVFTDCDGLVDVTIPNSVTAIGEGAFSECDELPTVIIPNNVTSIASKAFANCKELGKVTIGLQVGSIQDEAFFGCEKLNTVVNLSSLDIEKGSTAHGYVAYYANTVVTEGLFLDFEKLKLIVGESATLTATLISNEDYTIKWSTSNSAVAAVSNGKVTAKSAGTATITATAGGETATCVVTVDKPDMANGEYYLYDVDTKKFLSRGEYKGTCATVDKYGIPLVWTPWECSLKFLDSNLFLFETDDNNIYTDDASTGFVFEATDGGYLLKSQKSDCYLTIVDGAHTLQVVSVTDDTDAATVWQPMTKEEHDAIVAGYVTENYSNVLKAAEIPIATEKFLNHVNTRIKTDKTNAIGTARFNGTKGSWTYTGVNGKGTYGVDYCQLSEATGYHTQTITGLEKGIYKVTMQGFERSGSWERCNELAEQGYEITTATLIANGEEVNLKSWYSGKSDECNPDNTDEAVAKFAEGEYLNEVYTYVGKDGTLTLTVNMPSRVDGGWVLFNNFTLTHYSNKKDSGVESSVLEAQGSQPIYDLMGRRVENPTKGIYIINGKRILIK